MRRIAIIDYKKCGAPKKCNYVCMKYCPLARAGSEIFSIDERGKPVINENICIGCGICAKKCPFKAIKIVNLPDEDEETPVHKYGPSAFRLYGLPIPKKGAVVGLLGPNGIGKTTSLNILAGNLIPNLGKYDNPPSKEEVLKFFAGTELFQYLQLLYSRGIRCSYKIQYVDALRSLKGKVRDLLEQKGIDVEKVVEILKEWNSEYIIERNVENLSGGELQKLAIAIALSKDADIYFIDEPTSFLDIRERLRMIKIVRERVKDKYCLVAEHDLIILDALADYVHIFYGEKGAYGKVSNIKSVRVGINEYLDGYLRSENIRFRDYQIRFDEKAPEREVSSEILVTWKDIEVHLGEFTLLSESGDIRKGEVLGVLGPNGIGKTTFARVMAGELKPTKGEVSRNVKISYKPQFIHTESTEKVLNFLIKINKKILTEDCRRKIVRPLELHELFESRLCDLSGGELQRVAIAACLLQEADLYILDEPSAYLDVEQRLSLAKMIRRIAREEKKSVVLIDHDLLLVDYTADRILLFLGTPGKLGRTVGPLSLRDGMNIFLKEMDITVRRDKDTKRPRINKPGSEKDREQRKMGAYYYV